MYIFFVQKHSKHKRYGKKKTTKEKGFKNEMYGIKAWRLGYPKEMSHFIFIRPPHLNMLLKLNDTFILKV
jgi:hypothetical protein